MIMSFNLNMKLRKRLIIWERDKKKIMEAAGFEPGTSQLQNSAPSEWGTANQQSQEATPGH